MKPQEFTTDAAGRLVQSPGGYLAFVPHPLPAELRWDAELASRISAADQAIGRLDRKSVV